MRAPPLTVVLTGNPNCGKTTLFNLLARFYECGEGRITIDGIDARTLSKEWLRDQLG